MISERKDLETSTDPGDMELMRILRWLDENYTTDSWYQPK